jgi:TRAP transporter TAXI family solute receptor
MKNSLFVLCSVLVLVLYPSLIPLLQAEGIGMVTGSRTGTYIQFGNDMARIASKDGLEILVKDSEGSIDNIRRLISQENAALAIVQSDVLGFLKRSNDREMVQVSRKLRLIFPFYNEEVHLFARKGLGSFQDLRGKRVVVGTKGSGNWLTANNLLQMFNVVPAESIELSPPDGVSAVLAGSADAMFYVAGKPVKLFTNLQELQQHQQYSSLLNQVHFLPLDHERMLEEYIPSSIGPDDYKWLTQKTTTIAVKSALISFDFSSKANPYLKKRCDDIAKLGNAVRTNFKELVDSGHAKWKEVDLDSELVNWEKDTCSNRVTSKPKWTGKKKLEDELREILKRP